MWMWQLARHQSAVMLPSAHSVCLRMSSTACHTRCHGEGARIVCVCVYVCVGVCVCVLYVPTGRYRLARGQTNASWCVPDGLGNL